MSKMWSPAAASALLVIFVLLQTATPVAQPAADAGIAGKDKDAILVLDASGSMWGQIGGVNKIVIAKDVVEGLVRNLQVDQRLGLVAYGHRREGDCGDIETLADVGADRDAVISKLRALSPKGKTPLTKSVEHAAEELNYTKNAASVILVSDGLETCDADPCALARTLEENGLDFTVHVVGFDVTEEERAGLQCIADETGGEFLAADNADELTAALTQVAVATPQESVPVGSKVILKASILQGGPLIDADLSWTIVPAAGGNPVFTASDTGSVETDIVPGQYTVNAVWTGWRDGNEKMGSLDVVIQPQNVHVYTVPVDLNLPVTLEAPDVTGEGQAIDVTWTGPDSLGATVGVNRLDDAPRRLLYFFPAEKTRKAYQDGAAADTDGDGDFDQDDRATAKLAVPTQPGDYEIRYSLNDLGLILARRPLTVTDSQYTLSAPDEAPVSTEIEIAWNGPLTPGDIVTLVNVGEPRAFDNGRYVALKAGIPAKLTTPKEPGNYEIRYVMYGGYTTYPDMQHAVQETVPITVTDVAASLSAPAIAVGGSTIEVSWQGPAEGWQDDYISVVETGADKFNRDSRAPVAKGGEPLTPAQIRVPAIPGSYEVVYAIVPGNRIIARTPLSITPAAATVDAPETTKVGEDFEVSYSGDGFKGDRIVVVKADYPDVKMWSVGGNYGFWADASGTIGVVKGRAIPEPGEYEIRYVTGLQHQVLARDRLVVTE